MRRTLRVQLAARPIGTTTSQKRRPAQLGAEQQGVEGREPEDQREALDARAGARDLDVEVAELDDVVVGPGHGIGADGAQHDVDREERRPRRPGQIPERLGEVGDVGEQEGAGERRDRQRAEGPQPAVPGRRRREPEHRAGGSRGAAREPRTDGEREGRAEVAPGGERGEEHGDAGEVQPQPGPATAVGLDRQDEVPRGGRPRPEDEQEGGGHRGGAREEAAEEAAEPGRLDRRAFEVDGDLVGVCQRRQFQQEQQAGGAEAAAEQGHRAVAGVACLARTQTPA